MSINFFIINTHFCIRKRFFCMETHRYLETNKRLWNQKTPFHKESSFYNIEEFKKKQDSLNFIELEELGDVKGKSLLHLQCHFGMDTLSWAKRGAKVTGVDFSEEAIQLADALMNELHIPARFICADVLELQKYLAEVFDIVFTSYGVICWLPDLQPWAATVARFLKPGGTFYMIETHPAAMMFDTKEMKIMYSYFNENVIEETVQGTYADTQAPIMHKEYTWNHSLSDVLNALIREGLQIELFNEYPFYLYNCFPDMEEIEEGRWVFEKAKGKLPHLFSVRAKKL